jgi:CBS domain-containing protein
MVQVQQLLDLSVLDLTTDVNRVACVDPDNSLEHALLVLVKSGYSAIPVLDRSGTVQGTISKTLILDSILGLERIEFEQLGARKVKDVMNRRVTQVTQDEGFLRALELAINAPFLCVADEAGKFLGIVTRSSLLSRMHSYMKSELRTLNRSSSSPS